MSLKRSLPIIIFLIFYFLFSFLTYQDYGITWDERDVYSRGAMLFNHLVNKQSYNKNPPDLLSKTQSPGNVLYNHAYSTLLYLFNPSQAYENFHLLNMLFSSLIFVSSFIILYAHSKNTAYAVLGPLTLVLMPRFLGHIPSNPKDVPFAVMYFISLSCIFLLTKYKNILLRILVLGILFGASQSLRILGLSLYMVLFFFDLYMYFINKKRKRVFRLFILHEAAFLFLVFVIGCSFMVITWPYLGSNFFIHFIDILQSTKNFPWTGKILFMGKHILNKELPWYYLPVWIFITTPLIILFFFVSSFVFIKNKVSNKFFVLFNIALIINILFYFILKPSLYDGLRHFLFLLPLISTIATISFIEFYKSYKHKIKRNLILLLTVFNIALVVAQVVKLHPYEYVYFNELVRGLKGAYGRFETDYYGASYKEATEWLIKEKISDKDKIYKIKTCGHPFSSTYYFSENMKWVKGPEDTDYFICYTRFNKHKQVGGKILHIVKRLGVPLNYIKKLN